MKRNAIYYRNGRVPGRLDRVRPDKNQKEPDVLTNIVVYCCMPAVSSVFRYPFVFHPEDKEEEVKKKLTKDEDAVFLYNGCFVI